MVGKGKAKANDYDTVPVDTEKFEYCIDSASLLRFDPHDLAQGSIYYLRVVGWPDGYTMHSEFGAPGHKFLHQSAKNNYQVIELPATVTLNNQDGDRSMVAVAFRVHGALNRLSVLCVPPNLQPETGKWVNKEDWRYIALRNIQDFTFAGQAKDGSYLQKHLNEYIKSHCEIFKGTNLPQSIADCTKWFKLKWEVIVDRVIGTAERELRASVATDTGARNTADKRASKALKGVQNVVTWELDRRLALVRRLFDNLMSLTDFYDYDLQDRILVLSQKEIEAISVADHHKAGQTSQGKKTNRSWAIEVAKREQKAEWVRFASCSCAAPPPTSPTLRAKLVSAGDAIASSLVLDDTSEEPQQEEAQKANTPASPAQTAKQRSAAPQQVLEEEEVAVVEPDDADEFPDDGDQDLPELPPVEEPKRNRKPPKTLASPDTNTKSTKRAGQSAAKGAKKAKADTSKTSRGYNKSEKWFERYPHMVGADTDAIKPKKGKPPPNSSPAKRGSKCNLNTCLALALLCLAPSHRYAR